MVKISKVTGQEAHKFFFMKVILFFGFACCLIGFHPVGGTIMSIVSLSGYFTWLTAEMLPLFHISSAVMELWCPCACSWAPHSLSLVCISISSNGGFFCLKLVLNWSLLWEQIYLSVVLHSAFRESTKKKVYLVKLHCTKLVQRK